MVARCSVVARCLVVASSPVVVVVLAVVLGPGGAARAGSFTHQASVKPEVQLTERAKPPPRRADTPAPPSADDLLAVEVVLDEVHLEQVDLLRGLIARTPDDNADEKADYYLRLGELYGKTQRLHRLKGAEDEIALGKATDPKRRAALAASSAAHKTAETAAIVAAIETYRTLIETSRFARYPHLDTAVFNLAGTPATQVPVGLEDRRLPLGVQVVGAEGNDHVTIAVACALERALGGWVDPAAL